MITSVVVFYDRQFCYLFTRHGVVREGDVDARGIITYKSGWHGRANKAAVLNRVAGSNSACTVARWHGGFAL